jgi:hypothetical protein
MNPPISKEEQIVALLTGKVYKLIASRLGKSVVDVRRYLNVTRDELEEFLRVHPAEAERYFEEKSRRQPMPDTDVIGLRDGKYMVAWRDHDRNRFERSFPTMAEAVADHVLVTHGMN